VAVLCSVPTLLWIWRPAKTGGRSPSLYWKLWQCGCTPRRCPRGPPGTCSTGAPGGGARRVRNRNAILWGCTPLCFATASAARGAGEQAGVAVLVSVCSCADHLLYALCGPCPCHCTDCGMPGRLWFPGTPCPCPLAGFCAHCSCGPRSPSALGTPLAPPRAILPLSCPCLLPYPPPAPAPSNSTWLTTPWPPSPLPSTGSWARSSAASTSSACTAGP